MIDYKGIEKEAKKFLLEYGDIEANDNDATDIITIARPLGFKVIRSDIPKSGMIVISDELKDKYGTDRLILVNYSETPTRVRFTVAHELGHYYLKIKPEGLFNGKKYFAYRDSDNHDDEEKEANAFAAAVLMPEEKVRKVVKKTIEKMGMYDFDSTVVEVARTFLVSFGSATYRLMNLGYLVI